MTPETIVYLVILTACTAASGFFSGSETALIGISRERVHLLAEEDAAGKKLEQLISEPDRMLSTLLVANNTVNVLSASVATSDTAARSEAPNSRKFPRASRSVM